MAERGSMMPLFLGLIAMGALLSLGAAEVCSVTVFREQIQQVADQAALVSSAEQLAGSSQVQLKIADLVSRQDISVKSYYLNPDHTAELRVCGVWKSWLRLPGLDLNQTICSAAAAR